MKRKLFDEIPRLETERIVIKRIEAPDKDALRKLSEDPDVYRYLPAFLLEQSTDDIDEVLEKMYGPFIWNGESMHLGIYLKDGMAFCGIVELYDYKDSIHHVSIGYRLLKEFWGKGIATEAVRAVTEYVYAETDIEIITASVMPENEGSSRVLRKTDFRSGEAVLKEDWGRGEDTEVNKWFL